MMRMKKILTPLVILLGTFILNPVFAVEYQSPRTLALGGAGRAAPLLNDAIYLNPSYASFTPIYSLYGGYNWFNGGRNYNASIQDSRTELFQAGAGYTKREQNSAVNIGASKQIISRLGIGIGSKFILDNGTNKTTSNFSISSSFIATSWMYSSIIIDNILEGQEDLSRNLYRTFFAAFKFIPTKQVEIFLDPLYSPKYSAGKKAGYSVGVEVGLMADFYIRGGKFQNGEVSYLNTRGNGFGIGAGWLGPKLNIDYAMNRVLSSDISSGLTTSQSVSTTVFF